MCAFSYPYSIPDFGVREQSRATPTGWRRRDPLPRRVKKVSSLQPINPRIRGLEVETLDLLHSCPIWLYDGIGACLGRRIFGIRERWSYQRVMVAPPCNLRTIYPDDLQSSLFLLSSWRCPTSTVWRAIGPPPLLDDLEGSRGGVSLPWGSSHSEEEIIATHPLSLFLCPGQILGD